MLQNSLLFALFGTTFTFLGTILGSALVFFTRKQINTMFIKFFLGFASGIMISATLWSLLIPSIEIATKNNQNSLLASCGGLILGAIFLLIMDILIPHEKVATCIINNHISRKNKMLILAVTLHNIPEGIAVGLTFSACATQNLTNFMPAIILALGMALQNVPEGTAISLPLRSESCSKTKSFLYGVLSGAVEPFAGIIGVMLSNISNLLMPWLLSFAGGAMLYVVFEELIPNFNDDYNYKNKFLNHIGTVGAIIGFVVMMILELTLQ